MSMKLIASVKYEVMKSSKTRNDGEISLWPLSGLSDELSIILLIHATHY